MARLRIVGGAVRHRGTLTAQRHIGLTIKTGLTFLNDPSDSFIPRLCYGNRTCCGAGHSSLLVAISIVLETGVGVCIAAASGRMTMSVTRITTHRLIRSITAFVKI